MAKQYKYEGEPFLLDDTKGCYTEVLYKDQVGYVGVNLRGTADMPYSWRVEGFDWVTPDGLQGGNANGTDMESNVRGLCADLLRRHREASARKAFKPEEACKSMHEFVESLP